jgi:hypothetical protein
LSRYAIAFALSFCCAQAAYADGIAADQPAPSFAAAESGASWAWQVTPYLWAAGLKGTISPFQDAPTMGVDKSFSDVMRDFNVGGFVNVWGRRDRFVLSGDMMYVSTTNGRGQGPLSAFQIPGLGVAIPPGAGVDAKVDSKQFTASLQGGYRVVDTPRFTLDVLGGARFWHISTDVAVRASHPAIGTRSASHGEDFSWIDPLIGVRTFLPITDSFSLHMQADVGGFGWGSNHTWSALATINYVFSDRLSASAGYKVLDVDYKHRGHVYDVRLRGPVLGLTYRF